MNWHETIAAIRKDENYADLVRLAYFDENLRLNVERFGSSEEYVETLSILQQYAPNAKSLLDIGAGNGISSINFALHNYNVTVVEPDPSNSVGAEAIRSLKKEYKLDNIEIYQKFAEEVGFEDYSFDVVYVRQAMHHAYDLKKFLAECARVLKPGGLLLTIRDHVIYGEKDKEWFLENHPLHKFYGGENAFTAEEYKGAMVAAGLNILKEIKYYESPVNYFPTTAIDLANTKEFNKKNLEKELKNKIGIFAKIPFIFSLYRAKNGFYNSWIDEAKVPGRMYSYISKKV